VRAAQQKGASIEGVCIYPVTAYPGWDNSRHCHVGLFSSIDSEGTRHIYQPLRQELERQRELMMPVKSGRRRGLRLV
jgi:hypothetical protein